MDILLNDILRFVIMAIWLTTVSLKEQDVCFWTTYELTCDETEVIQMEHALYGRMSVGSCIPENVGIMMGCQEDVLEHLDSVCSGRQSCKLQLPEDGIATAHQPCPRGLEAYLQLQYNCITVYTLPTPCGGNPLTVKGTTGLLANFVTEETGQGSQECPWEIRGSPGQKVRLTLYDYGVWNPSTPEGVGGSDVLAERTDICRIYARVSEAYPTGNSITICGGEEREKVVYMSETESVYIALTNPEHSQQAAYFVLRYEVIGCLTYIPPEGAVIVRYENDISVSCQATGSEWKMVCDGTQWRTEGNVSNCTEIRNKQTVVEKGEQSVSMETVMKGGLTLSQGLVIAFFLSIAVLIAVIIMVIGIVVLRRRQETVIESTPGYNCKEHVPMLTKHQWAQQSLGNRSYTTTPQRQAAVPSGTVTHRGKFSPLPPPPTSSFQEAGHCTIHGSLSRDRYPQGSNPTTQSIMDQSSSNDWQNSVRRTDRNGKAKDHFYHELDPEQINVHAGPPLDQKELDIERFGLDEHVAPLPDVLSKSTLGQSNYDV